MTYRPTKFDWATWAVFGLFASWVYRQAGTFDNFGGFCLLLGAGGILLMMYWEHVSGPGHEATKAGFKNAVVSVGLGLIVAVSLFLFQIHHTNEARKKQLRGLLATEIGLIIRDLHPAEHGSRGPLYVEIIVLTSGRKTIYPTRNEPLILEEAIKSGLFSRNETVGLYELAHLIRTYNSALGDFPSVTLASNHIPGMETKVEEHIANIDAIRLILLRSANQIRRGMGLEVTDFEKYRVGIEVP